MAARGGSDACAQDGQPCAPAAGPSGSGCGEVHEAPLQDRVAEAVVRRFDGLPGRGKPQGSAWTVLAGIVAEEPDLPLRVLSLATGTRCIGVAAMTQGRGRAVHDCHAEVLCRRAFHRFLFRELEAGGKDAGSILEQEGAATWRVRPGVRLHFYVSTLPCGECTMVPISSTAEGTLGRKYLGQEEQARAGPTPLRDRNRTGAKPSTGMPEDPKANGIGFHCGGILRYKSGRSDTKPECRSVCYSCSEKLCRWNHTGWQGALLARLIPQPLTMASVVIGGPLFDEGFVREALFDRAGSPSPGVARPAFLQTSVPFHSSREVLQEPRGDPVQAKISTAGLSVVWCSPCGPEAAPAPRSISRAVPGFYDVLIGHTGERQGLRADRRKAAGTAVGAGAGGSAGATAAAGSGAAPAPGPLDSWVSPLSKWLMAQDSLASLERLLGGEEALLKWLSEGAEGLGASLGERQEASPSRAGSSADASSEGAGGSPPPKKRRLSLPCTPSYAWLKDAAAGAGFRERRRRFHQSALFSHWRRKRALSFGSPGAGVSSEERRVEDPGPDVVDGFAVALPEGRSLGGGARSAGDRDPEGKEGRPG